MEQLPAQNYLLHEENLDCMPFSGQSIKQWLHTRAAEIVEATANTPDPDISIVIRTRNDGEHIKRLFSDIKTQVYGGAIEIIVVDTESRDDTATYAASQGAKVITITQEEFNYPRAINLGFQAASHPWVVTIVGHSSLSSRLFLKSLTYWSQREPKLGGLYSLPLPNWNASISERLEIAIKPTMWKEPRAIPEISLGIMGANCSMLKREVWQQLDGYDERYAGGGEDRAFAQTMLDHGVSIMREPLSSVYHSHGLNLHNSIKQWLHWGSVAKGPSPFITNEVHSRRPDLQ